MKKLLVPLFPLFGYSSQVPYWVHELSENASTHGYVVYDVRKPFQGQGEDLLEVLSTRKVSRRAVRGFDLFHDPDHRAFFASALSQDHLRCFADDYLADVVMLRDSYVMARASAVIVDVNHPSYGEHLALAMMAAACGVPVIVVNDRILAPPAFTWVASAVTDSSKILPFLRKFLRLKAPKPAAPEVTVPVAPKVDPFDTLDSPDTGFVDADMRIKLLGSMLLAMPGEGATRAGMLQYLSTYADDVQAEELDKALKYLQESGSPVVVLPD